jgi:voltage-gated potassium channel
MLPFLFIRLFYAPWLEARIRLRAPREAPAGMQNGELITPLASETVLPADAELIMLGSHDQRVGFVETFGKA